MSQDWEDLVGAAFLAAFALFVFLFLSFADFSTTSASIDSLERFIVAATLSIVPSGLSLWIDLAAAALSGVVSVQILEDNALAALFAFLFVYFFVSISVNYLFVA